MDNFRLPPIARFSAIYGPGLLVMLADTDAGNVITAAQGAALWGHRTIALWLMLIVPLYLVQELAVRLGLYTGRGYVDLVQHHFGQGWAKLLVATLAIAAISTLVTEFSAIAGIGELYGLPRAATLPLFAALLLGVVSARTYRTVEQIAIVFGLFELAFLAVAWSSWSHPAALPGHASLTQLRDHRFLYTVAAIIGATFNPWMIFYQQSAVVKKGLTATHYRAACCDTALGAVLAQVLCAAIVVSVASVFGVFHQRALDSIGAISLALDAMLGQHIGRAVFSIGIVGSATVAAIVVSLTMSWSVRELVGTSNRRTGAASGNRAVHIAYAAGVITSMALVWGCRDLVWLSIAAQVANVFLLPLVLCFLVMLAGKALPAEHRLRGAYRIGVVAMSVAICACGWVGGLQPLWSAA